MRQFVELKRWLRELTHGRMILRRAQDERGVFLIEDRDAPFCHRLDRVTVCYGLSEVERFILSLN